MKQLNPLEHLWMSITGWKGFKYPDTSDFPPKPWHPDGDAFFTKIPDFKVKNSDAIIAYMKTTPGRLLLGRGGTTKPDSDGKVGGIFLNMAGAEDPQYVISKEPGPGRLFVSTYHRAPYGKKVRIPRNAIAQGYPMNEYSDHKMHIFDVIDRTITEIQFITEPMRGPIGLLLSLLGKGGDQYHCHGVKQYSIDVPSTDDTVRGSSAAKIPIAYTSPLYDDLARGFVQMLTMGTTMARKGSWVWPAENSDGPSENPNAIMMGQVLRLNPEKAEELLKTPGVPVYVQTFIRCMAGPGIMIIDTGGNHSVGVTPDNRIGEHDFDVLKSVKLDDFEVWQHEAP